MEELSIFVDESGDFGEYDIKSPCYLVRCLDVRFQTFCVQKKQISDERELSEKLSKIISSFIQSNFKWFLSNDTIKLY